MKLKQGQEYKCWFTGRVLQFVDWFTEDSTPYVRDNYDPSFTGKKGKRTWNLKYITEEASILDISNYKNKIYNTHEFNNFSFIIEEDIDFIYAHDEHSLIEFSTKEMEEVLKLKSKGFIKKY